MYRAVNLSTGATVGTGYTKDQALAMKTKPSYKGVVFRLETKDQKEVPEQALAPKAQRKEKEAAEEQPS